MACLLDFTDDLTWSSHTTRLVKKAQQRLHFGWMRRADLPPPALTSFYRGAIESVLSSSLPVWYGSGPAADQKALPGVVRRAEKFTRSAQPSIQDLHPSHCRKRATAIIKGPSHPAHKLLPSGKRYRSMHFCTLQYCTLFEPQ